ncbi:hypothetical protein D0C36_20045 [Mucilaginibacter conchicola]|uniref:Transcriptional regulator, AbiEi antitoxin, Type IV TA system n=1 Tax=Mucilaginibacter conchicola TaxID=2303333 RepID=A0A372NRH2_9SPHI|nr:hypothetical protein [Mucilaginibacter conchicola]RFZ91230.1 hypothetical protein D0C36_20045 [Mucilaginibacter conchicola]
MSKSLELKKHLRRGNVYRRSELEQWSNSVDRHIGELIGNGTLEKVGPSLYYYPKQNVFGKEPPSNKALVGKYLKDGKFLITSYNHYNKLGLGTTQLYNSLIVYNHSKSGEVKLGNKVFIFRKKGDFPAEPSKEYLVIDLVNNLSELAEDQPAVLERVQQALPNLNAKALRTTLQRYGTAKTRKILGSGTFKSV